MAVIQITINDTLLPEALLAWATEHPIPTNAAGVPLYTPAQWPRICIINEAKKVIKNYRRRQAICGIISSDLDTLIT